MFNFYSSIANRFSGFALGLCGALLITTAVQTIPTFGQAQPAAVIAGAVAKAA
ncbi:MULTISPECIES: hypothetical protein [unclassified Brevundimonas]|uniref:hypothetical protein n=1 Tax=unclassified Brevundimonas TaxID=2622653 RepID=UPI0025C43E0D|nr:MULTISPECIES: hypothetical protein [unclassified Brevundimonas]